ncbi:hypothetical protein E3N88_03621 [Mikania micrantha]|uniref:Uncharacterized protein n=1 Tax=Mikania micrantha TaxID=192012 RepID=A0A5N6Q726_9ASTR|nr:hypothetical protein E3N88_03621 [Mikania micrantha]
MDQTMKIGLTGLFRGPSRYAMTHKRPYRDMRRDSGEFESRNQSRYAEGILEPLSEARRITTTFVLTEELAIQELPELLQHPLDDLELVIDRHKDSGNAPKDLSLGSAYIYVVSF